MDPSNIDFWWSALSGVIGNLAFTILLVLGLQRLRYFIFIWCRFHNTQFNSYWKRFPNDEVHTISCKVKANRIIFSGNRIGSKDIFNGEIIVNPINLSLGEGFHIHSLSDGFAFVKIIIEDNNTVLMESHYTAAKKNSNTGKIVGNIIPQAFIWKRVAR